MFLFMACVIPTFGKVIIVVQRANNVQKSLVWKCSKDFNVESKQKFSTANIKVPFLVAI